MNCVVALQTEGKLQSEYTLSFVLLQEGEWWVGQCLEFDIATQAKTLSDLHYEIGRTVVGHFEVSAELGLEPFKGLSPAPPSYWRMFEKSKLNLQGDKLPFHVPGRRSLSIPIPTLRLGVACKRWPPNHAPIIN